jgi:hypothetical protein
MSSLLYSATHGGCGCGGQRGVQAAEHPEWHLIGMENNSAHLRVDGFDGPGEPVLFRFECVCILPKFRGGSMNRTST